MIRILLLPLSLVLNLVPLHLSQLAVGLFADLFRVLIGFRYATMNENLRIAYRDSLSEAERKDIIAANYRHYAFVVLEIIRSLIWSRQRMAREVEVIGYEQLESLAKRGGGFVLTSHLGNWEYSILATSARGLPVDIVVKESQTAVVEKFLQWFRRRFGAGILLESNTAKEILYSVTHGRVVAVILDQFMGPPIGLPVSFFGERAGTAVALSLFVEKKDVPVIPAYNYRDSKGRICVVIEDPLDLSELGEDKAERLYKMTQAFNDRLERHVRKHPEQWLWLHRRWKSYKGEPRWMIKPANVVITLLLFVTLSACSSKNAATPTGIELPPDAAISIPNFKNVESDVEVPSSSTPMPSPSSSPSPTPKGKKKKKESVMNTPAPSPTPSPAAKTTVNIIPFDKIPFEVGEQLVIDLNWTALPAGRAVIEVREGPSFNGRATFQLWGNVLSSKLVDTIYHVDNTIESFVDRQGLIPYKFLLHMVESKQLKETRVSFDHVNQKASYWAKRISERWGNSDVDRVDPLVPQSKDMFSALYFARSLTYSLNKMQVVPVYENGQNWNIEVTPVANEFVNSGVGAFQCWKLKITAKLNNVLSPTGDMYLWVSDDSKKYPVKFDTKLKIGSLLGSLTSIKER